MNKRTINETAATGAYIKAYMEGPDWSDIFPAAVEKIFLEQAKRYETSTSMVVANVLASISTVLGPNSKVDFGGPDHYVGTNIYQLLVAASGSGKSHTYYGLFEKPIRALESERKLNLIVQDFTPSGFARFLISNSGFAALSSDEFCQVMRSKLASQKDEYASLRSQLNSFYNCRGFSKVYSGVPKIDLQNVYLTIFGATQPHPYASFHYEMDKLTDGLVSRFMVICCAPYQKNDTEPEPLPNGVYQLSQVMDKYLLKLYDMHQAHPANFRFSLEAVERLQSIKEVAKEANRAQYEAAEEKYQEGDAGLCDIPEIGNNTFAKDFEYVLKYSALIHVICSSIEQAVSKKFNQIAISPIIEKETVEKAHRVVVCLRRQQSYFKKVFEELLTPVEEATRAKYVMEKSQVNIPKTILLFPGKATSSGMIIRAKTGRIKAKVNDLPTLPLVMESMSKEIGAPGFVGIYKKMGNKHVFYKAPPNIVDVEYLQSIGIPIEMYQAAFNHDMTESPSSGIKPDWKTYYENLLSKVPEGLQSD